MQQIRTALPIGARGIVVSVYWRRNTHLSFFSTFIYLPISILSAVVFYHLYSTSPLEELWRDEFKRRIGWTTRSETKSSMHKLMLFWIKISAAQLSEWCVIIAVLCLNFPGQGLLLAGGEWQDVIQAIGYRVNENLNPFSQIKTKAKTGRQIKEPWFSLSGFVCVLTDGSWIAGKRSYWGGIVTVHICVAGEPCSRSSEYDDNSIVSLCVRSNPQIEVGLTFHPLRFSVE